MAEEQNANIEMDKDTYAAIQRSREQFNSIPAPVDEPEPQTGPLIDRKTWNSIEKSRDFVENGLSWTLTPEEEAKVFGSASVANRIDDPSQDGMSITEAVEIIRFKHSAIWAEVAAMIAATGAEFVVQAERVENSNQNYYQRSLGVKAAANRVAGIFDTALERLTRCTSEEKRQIPEDILVLLRTNRDTAAPEV